MITIMGFARRIAHEEGVKPATNSLLEFVVWGHTGYPAFWQTDDPIKEFEEQLRLAFRKGEGAICLG